MGSYFPLSTTIFCAEPGTKGFSPEASGLSGLGEQFLDENKKSNFPFKNPKIRVGMTFLGMRTNQKSKIVLKGNIVILL